MIVRRPFKSVLTFLSTGIKLWIAAHTLRVQPAAIDECAKKRDGRLNAEKIEFLESELLKLEQVNVPLTHRFAPGVYMREVLMPAGTFVIGHEHKTEHFNIVVRGKVSVMMDGEISHISGYSVFRSGPGVRKVLYIHEDTQWATIHPTDETDIKKLEKELIIKSQSYELYQQDVAKFKLALQPLIAEGASND